MDGLFYKLAVKDAAIEGMGVSHHNTWEPVALDSDTGMVTNLGVHAKVTFTVPAGVKGIFDVYLTVGKCLCGGSSTPFGISINNAPPMAVPLAYQVAGESPYAYNEDGCYDVGSFRDTGDFMMKAGVYLQAGDTLAVVCMYGGRGEGLLGTVFPDIGDITLVPASSPVKCGYDQQAPQVQPIDSSDPISGKRMLWLGSSVTYGAAAGGYYSMADEIACRHPAAICDKYAVSGTTLTHMDEESYVARLMTISPDIPYDLFVLQLSTNDATTQKPLGHISPAYEAETFDTSTVLGAMETIIAYVQKVFRCPVLVYTETYFESAEYTAMVNALWQLQKKWGFFILDLYNNPEMTAIFGSEKYQSYMHDPIHPFRRGYVEWWTPAFEEKISRILSLNSSQERDR
jgi:hypothetical protein